MQTLQPLQWDIGQITIGGLLDKVASRQGDRTALWYPQRQLRYSYREFNEHCRRTARGLMALGINAGEHIAVWANNVPEWTLLQFGSPKMGAALVTLNVNYRPAELEYALRQSDATTLFLVGGLADSHEYVDSIYEICPELRDCSPGQLHAARLPQLRHVVHIGDERHPGMYNWSDLLQLADTVAEAELDARQATLRPDDVVNIQYTSGTTGFYKGVMLTHTNVIGNAVSIADCLRFTPADLLCIPVPFFHCFGCVLGTMTCVVSGAAMVPTEKPLGRVVLETVEACRCTAVHGVPTMFIAYLEEMEKRTYDLSSLRTGIMAGSPCPAEVMKAVVEKMGAREICITYGLTEASPAITMTRTDDPLDLRVSTVGRKLPGVEVKIVDPETGEDLAAGATGELCTRGYHVMKGYYNMPEATAAAIDADAWLHSGDLATVDEQGYYRITGRWKDMYIRGGENVYPREIEEFLYTHPQIKDAQVVGIPNSYYGEVGVAFIQLRPGETSQEKELKKFCRGKIAPFKIPSYFLFVDDFPKTASGKVQKYKLRELAVAELGYR